MLESKWTESAALPRTSTLFFFKFPPDAVDMDTITFPTWPGKPTFDLRYTSKGHYVLPFSKK